MEYGYANVQYRVVRQNFTLRALSSIAVHFDIFLEM